MSERQVRRRHQRGLPLAPTKPVSGRPILLGIVLCLLCSCGPGLKAFDVVVHLTPADIKFNPEVRLQVTPDGPQAVKFKVTFKTDRSPWHAISAGLTLFQDGKPIATSSIQGVRPAVAFPIFNIAGRYILHHKKEGEMFPVVFTFSVRRDCLQDSSFGWSYDSRNEPEMGYTFKLEDFAPPLRSSKQHANNHLKGPQGERPATGTKPHR